MIFNCSIAPCSDSGDARFVLAGIVNRMDRAFVSPESCGDIRLIYRLTRTAPAARGRRAVTPADDAEHRAEGEGRRA